MKKGTHLRLLWMSLFFLAGFGNLLYGATVRINELMASNTSVITDPDGNQFADWIELYNTTSSSVSLTGYCLTDDPAQPDKWQFPSGVSIAGGGYLIVWADGLDMQRNGVHTNFKLDADGEAVGFFDPSFAQIETIEFKKQKADASYGHAATDPATWLFFAKPTPGAANSTTGVTDNTRADDPLFSQAGEFYSSALTLTLTPPSQNAVIRYTLDGSIPTESSSLYTAPIAINQTIAVRARSYQAGLLPSDIITQTYFINATSVLPVVSIVTDPKFLSDNALGIYVDQNIASRKDWERPADITLIEPSGQVGFQTTSTIRLFGNTAFYLPEKSLAVFPNSPVNYPIFPDQDVPSYDSFILRSSSDDWHLTMFRDALIQMLTLPDKKVDRQAYRPSVVYINGEYFGIHNLREKYNPAYLTAHHGIDSNNIDLLYLDERQTDPVTVLNGDRVAYDQMIDFLETHDMSDAANYAQVQSWIDIDNFVDYIALEVYIGNTSWNHNFRIWRTRNPEGPFHFLLFDTDRGFKSETTDVLADMLNNYTVLERLWQNATFRQKYADRFCDLMNFRFTPDRVNELSDSLSAWIAPEMPNHIQRWNGICGNGVCGISSMTSWQNAVDDLKWIAQARYPRVFDQLASNLGNQSLVGLNLSVTPSGLGAVSVNDEGWVHGSFYGEYIKDSQIHLKAIPNPGYVFTGWGGVSTLTIPLFPAGSIWKYLDNGSNQGTAWQTSGFDDSGWASGPGQLGYGDGDEATVVSYGPNASQKYVTTYFRKSFTITDPTQYHSFVLRLIRDDGCVIYLNGQEIYRTNMPAGSIDYTTLASGSVGDETLWQEQTLNPSLFVSGQNLLAVEMHQGSQTSSDLSFDLSLSGLSTGTEAGSSTETELTLTLNKTMDIEARFQVNAAHQLSADIHGTVLLTAANSPYFASGTVTVQSDGILQAEPGVEIRMPTGAHLIVQGALDWQGTETQPVKIVGVDSQKHWGAIFLDNAASPSTLRHVHIDGASTGPDAVNQKAAFNVFGSSVVMDDVKITRVTQPVYTRNSEMVITNSHIDGTDSGDDIINLTYGSALVENNTLIGNGEVDFDYVDNGILRGNTVKILSDDPNRDGIDIGTSKNVLIEGNRVMDCPDKGISIGEQSTATVRKNVIMNTSMGVAVKDGSTVLIDRNTIIHAAVGVSCYQKTTGGGTATIINTIFSEIGDNNISIDALSQAVVSYSLSDKTAMTGSGNLFTNPGFIDPAGQDYRLRSDSPCIDAGDPATEMDPDGSRADIGALPYENPANSFAGIHLNEVMPANTKTIRDEHGEYDDWIEIYNARSTPVDLAGLYLSDSPDDLTRWQLPEGHADLTTVPAEGHLILWADNSPEQGVNHLGFRLNTDGEFLVLVSVYGHDTSIVDSVMFGKLEQDQSYGRMPNGSGSWQALPYPTPGRSNSSPFVKEMRLISPSDGAVIQVPSNGVTPLTFIWTAYHPDDLSGQVIAYDFRMLDETGDVELASSRQDTTLTFNFNVNWAGNYSWTVFARTSLGDSTRADTFTLAFDNLDTVKNGKAIPEHFALHQNYPNPFNPTTRIDLDLPAESEVKVTVYDMRGRRVCTLLNGRLSAGVHQIIWNAQDDFGQKVTSGIYLCKVEAGSNRVVRKMILMK